MMIGPEPRMRMLSRSSRLGTRGRPRAGHFRDVLQEGRGKRKKLGETGVRNQTKKAAEAHPGTGKGAPRRDGEGLVRLKNRGEGAPPGPPLHLPSLPLPGKRGSSYLTQGSVSQKTRSAV